MNAPLFVEKARLARIQWTLLLRGMLYHFETLTTYLTEVSVLMDTAFPAAGERLALS
jgi:hypothetical protein